MKHKLLVAVDGEKTSLKIIDYVARACAGSTDDEFAIVVFHVLPTFPICDYLAPITVPVVNVLDWFDNQTRTAATEVSGEDKGSPGEGGGEARTGDDGDRQTTRRHRAPNLAGGGRPPLRYHRRRSPRRVHGRRVLIGQRG